MVDVGLTGGLGSGKSTVAGMLAARGAHVIDADQLARTALAPGSAGLAAVVAELGSDLLLPDGSLDRGRLAARIFHDPPARAAVEAIVHPEVGRLTRLARAELPPWAVVVHDVPLLVEARLADRYDLVVVVEAAPTARLARVMARGLTEADARARMAAQASDSERRAAADVLVPNDGDLGDLEDHVAALWRRLADLSAASDRDDPVGGTS